jgi:hypothetical protein
MPSLPSLKLVDDLDWLKGNIGKPALEVALSLTLRWQEGEKPKNPKARERRDYESERSRTQTASAR